MWWTGHGADVLGHLVGIGPDLAGIVQPGHHRGDRIARPRRIVVQDAQNVLRRQGKPQFLLQLPQGGDLQGLARIAVAAGQGPLSRMGAQGRSPPGQQEGRLA